jgi:hypothetical protein
MTGTIWGNLDGFGWLLLILGPLVFIQRWLHREVQIFFIWLTGRHDLAVMIAALLFFPGVLIHEASHYLAATLLRVQTGRFSILPRRLPGGKLQLGYVETARADFIRESMIGAAPIFSGAFVLGWIGSSQFGLSISTLGNAGEFIKGFLGLTSSGDFWLWFYLTFCISSTMLPSAADRRAWAPMIIFILVLIAMAFLLGVGPWVSDWLFPRLNRLIKSLTWILSASMALQLSIAILIGLVNRLAMRVLLRGKKY